MTHILLDADSIVWKVGAATDNRHYLYKGRRFESKAEANSRVRKEEGDLSSITLGIDPEPEDKVRDTLLPFIEEKLALVPDAGATLFLGSQGNFREGIGTLSTYKGNRDRSSIPTHTEFIRNTIIDNYETVIARPELETDDEVSIAARDPKEETVILSIDKDLLQIPGAHVNFDNGKETIVDGFYGIKLLAGQMLTGDASDNVHGLAGVGPKSKHLKNIKDANTIEEVWAVVLNLYQQYYGYYAYQFMRENFMLLRLVGEPTVYEVFFMHMLNIQEDYWR